MNNNELLRCPFCGGEADILQHKDGIDDWIVFCKKCGCQTDFMFTEYEAIHAWNTRNYPVFPDSSKVNQPVQVPEVVENGICEYLPEECCKKSCKQENATFKTLVHKWTKHSIEDYLYLSVELYKYCVLWFEYWSESGQLTVCIVNNSSEELLYEDIGVFNTIKEANSKVIEFIKELGERLVCFADNIRIEE